MNMTNITKAPTKQAHGFSVRPDGITVICPHCDYHLDGWLQSPLGLSYECEECKQPFDIPSTITINSSNVG